MRGIYTALVTPFDSNGAIDLGAFKRLLRDQRDAGVAGVIPCGTTGESPTLSIEEKKLLIETCFKELRGSSLKVIPGTGSNQTAETVALSRWASEQGADGILVVTPYYNKPTAAGLEAHFRAVADAVTCDVILYNVPSRTGVTLTTGTICSLASHPQITALKEATGNVQFTSEIIDQLRQRCLKLDILSGDDATFLPLLAIGATGVISVASNLFPRSMLAIQEAVDAANFSEALELHQKFFPLFRDLFIETNPGPIKAALSLTGHCEPFLRAPLAPLSAPSLENLKLSLARCGISPGARL